MSQTSPDKTQMKVLLQDHTALHFQVICRKPLDTLSRSVVHAVIHKFAIIMPGC